MPVRPLTEQDVPRVITAWCETLRYDPITEPRFRHLLLQDPNHEPEGTLIAESEEGRLLGFAATVVRRTVAGKDGGGGKSEFHRGFLKAFFMSEGEEGEHAAADLLDAAEVYCREAGKTVLVATEYTGPYVFPGVDVRYQRLRDLLMARGYRDVYTIENVVVDLTDPKVQVRHDELRARLESDVAIVAWDPARLLAMRAFVAEGKMPQWFPPGWENGLADPHDNVFILSKGAEILGWAQYSLATPRAGFGPILVLPRARGRNYGAALLLTCMVHARAAGAERMSAGWANTGFYVRHGWSIARRYAVLLKELTR